MYYVAFDTFHDEDSGYISHDREDILEKTKEWNRYEEHRRFIPLAIDQHDQHYRYNPYRNNSHDMTIPLKRTVTPVRSDWYRRVIQLLNEFFDPKVIEWGVAGVPAHERGGKVWWRIPKKTKEGEVTFIEFWTSLTGDPAEGGYSYRIGIGSDPGWTPAAEPRQLRINRGRRYYKYYITDAYLSNSNEEVMKAVFRLLFMGDPFLTPFLSSGRKILSIPQEKALKGFVESYYVDKKRKGAIILPTGVGKTVVAARIFMKMDPKRILFIADKNFILSQAIKTFKFEAKHILSSDIGKFYGTSKDKKEAFTKRYVFANPQSLHKAKGSKGSPKEFVKWGKPNDFDLIIIDEFHHGQAETWKNIIKYFKPKFLLGLTATPHRPDIEPMDLVERNILYKAAKWEEDKWLAKYEEKGIWDIPTLSLISAIDLGYLVYPTIIPMEEPDYWTTEGLLSKKDKYKAGEIRDEKIIEVFKSEERLKGKQAVVFCSRIEEATRMAESFNKAGIVSDHLVGGKGKIHGKCCRDTTPYDPPGIPTENQKRSVKLYNFDKKKTQVLFVVDVLNEGVDIKNIEAILWLKKIDSIVMLLQQLGRGLRLSIGKRELLVFDFMGNVARVAKYLEDGFPSPTGKKPKKRKKKKDVVRENELELLECLGFVMQIGDEITLIPTITSSEKSYEEIAPFVSPKDAIIEKIPPKLTSKQRADIRQTNELLKRLRAKVSKEWKIRNEDDVYIPQYMARDLDIDFLNMMEILVDAGLERPRKQELKSSNIQVTYHDDTIQRYLKTLSKKEKEQLRNILEINNTIPKHRLGSRHVKSVHFMGGIDRPSNCRIQDCLDDNEHRGMCTKHYLFAFQEIYTGRANEADLVARFLLEPRKISGRFKITEKEKPTKKKAKKITKKVIKKKSTKIKESTKKKPTKRKKKRPRRRYR